MKTESRPNDQTVDELTTRRLELQNELDELRAKAAQLTQEAHNVAR